MQYKNGTLLTWHSGGSTYYGFVVGTCSYDNCGKDNAYVARYVFKDNFDAPRHPYTVVDMTVVELVKDWPDKFYIGGHWSRSPEDRCDEWNLQYEDGKIMILPVKG